MKNESQTTARRLMFFPEVEARVGFNRWQIARMEKAGRFPRRRQVSPNRVAWLSDEVEAWLENLPKGVATDQGARKSSDDRAA